MLSVDVAKPAFLKVDVDAGTLSRVRQHLTYRDKAALFEYQRLKRGGYWYTQEHGQDAYEQALAEAKSKLQRCVLLDDPDGGYRTYTGLGAEISPIVGESVINQVVYPEPKWLSWHQHPPDLRPYQQEAKQRLLEAGHGAVSMGCHRRGERVLMFDGSLKAVEDVAVGDCVMGPDSRPRRVLELKRGVDSMYEIETVNGQRMYVNGAHILSLRHARSQENVLVTVNEYVSKSPNFRYLHKLYTVPVQFGARDVPLDPYLVGVILGEVNQGRFARVACDAQCVPDVYKINSSDVQRQVLAGLIDADGWVAGGRYDVLSKTERLAQDVCFLARSLGLRASISSCRKGCQTGAVGTYWRVTLSGNIDLIPVRLPRKKALPRRQKKNPLSFGFKVRKVAESEEHFGFVLNEDHLYLTDSFLVTHNTGVGKSYIIMHLAREIGQFATVMVPSISIASQMYKDFHKYLGDRCVGIYGGGKKKLGRRITIAVAASLAKVERGTDAFAHFSRSQVFIADESHQTPAATMARVCMGLFAHAPYRFFFSGTQVRGDGADLLLKGIIGPIVFSMTVREGVDQGYLAKPIFKMVRVNSPLRYESRDVNRMTRAHLYYNSRINKFAGDLANKSVSLLGHSVLILVDEFEQFTELLPYLRHEVRFAHGTVTKENAAKLPGKYHDSDPTELVDAFNRREFPILVGTSCIATGTDTRVPQTMFFMRGGKSEVEVKQSIGRGTRLMPEIGKTTCNVIDFDVENVERLHDHALARADLYNEIYGPVEYVDLRDVA